MGGSITFTASGVVDNGGVRKDDCVAKTEVPGGSVTYTWTLTLPAGYPPPLPPLTGSGASVGVVAKVPGSYSVSFTANPTRTKCQPASITLSASKVVPVPTATLSISPVIIPANTPWTGMPVSVSQANVTVTWNPPNCVGTLEIAEIVGTSGYVPPSDATLTKVTDTHWRYTAYGEPQSEHCSNNAQVWIAAVNQGVELTRRSLTVVPVHFWLTQTAQRDFWKDYDYIRWKYVAVLATTGGAFAGTPSISASGCVSCGLGLPPPCVAACTHSDNTVDFGRNTFNGSENQAASIIGHELVHTAVGPMAGECPAYQWEADHAFGTGTIPCDTAWITNVLQFLANPDNCP